MDEREDAEADVDGEGLLEPLRGPVARPILESVLERQPACFILALNCVPSGDYDS